MLVLAARLSGDADLIALLSGTRPMTPFAAMGVLGSALSLLFLSTSRSWVWSAVPATVTAGTGLLGSITWATRWWPNVLECPATLAVQEWVGDVPNRPSIPSCIALLLLGLSLICRGHPGEVRQRIADVLAVGAFGTAWVSVIGGTFSAAVVSFVPRATMNLFTAGCIVAVVIGSLALRTDRGIGAVFSSQSCGGRMSRFLVPLALGVPIVLAVVAGGALPDGHLPKGRAAAMFASYCLTLALVGMYLSHGCTKYERQLKSAEREREKVITDLQRSLQEVHALESEIVRMCAWTQTIEDEGRWISFEEFLRDRLHIQVEPAISPAGIKLLKNKRVSLEKAAPRGQS